LTRQAGELGAQALDLALGGLGTTAARAGGRRGTRLMHNRPIDESQESSMKARAKSRAHRPLGSPAHRDTARLPLGLPLGPAVALALGLALWLPGWAVRAEADGPDHYRVTGVAAGDVLNLRAEPSAGAKKVAEIPADGNCLRNLGCRGGLTFAEFATLSQAERAERERANPRWCKVEYQGSVGWVAGAYLAEGDCPQAR
jgi:hypothetical protein